MSHARPCERSTILVVDDEIPLRDYMARVMAGDGYCVLTAGDGIEALTLLESSRSRVDLVITDVVMPRMNGPELAAQLAAQLLSPPILFVSGGHSLGEIPGPMLRKPFRATDLSVLVRSLIRGGEEALPRP
jgi:CheY-like chemotaxis protein